MKSINYAPTTMIVYTLLSNLILAASAEKMTQYILVTGHPSSSQLIPRESGCETGVAGVNSTGCTSPQPKAPSTQHAWYPDVMSSAPSCQSDERTPAYMKADPTPWLFADVESCCQAHYAWDIQGCISNSDDPSKPSLAVTVSVSQTSEPNREEVHASSPTTQLWHPDLTMSSSISCKSVGRAPDYMENDSEYWMFDDVIDCCEAHFVWDVEDCISNSAEDQPAIITAPTSPANETMPICMVVDAQVINNNKWYPDLKSSEDGCRNDGHEKMMDYVREYDVSTFDSEEDCCIYYYPWSIEDCIGGDGSALASEANRQLLQ